MQIAPEGCNIPPRAVPVIYMCALGFRSDNSVGWHTFLRRSVPFRLRKNHDNQEKYSCKVPAVAKIISISSAMVAWNVKNHDASPWYPPFDDSSSVEISEAVISLGADLWALLWAIVLCEGPSPLCVGR